MDRLGSMLEGAEDDDVRSGLKRYVGRGGRGTGGRGNRDDRDAKLRDLAGATLRGDTLASELPWLVTDEAEAGHRFGYALAVQDRGYTMMLTHFLYKLVNICQHIIPYGLYSLFFCMLWQYYFYLPVDFFQYAIFSHFRQDMIPRTPASAAVMHVQHFFLSLVSVSF